MNNEDTAYIEINTLLKYLWRGKYIIFIITLLFSLISVFYALSIPNYYKSSALLKVAGQNSNPSIMSQYSGLASIAGISLPSNGSQNDAYLATATLKSRDFLNHLIKLDDEIVPALIATKDYDIINANIIYDKNSYDVATNKWIREPSYPFKTIPSNLEVYEKYINEVLSTSIDKESGYISISVQHISPKFAYKFLNLIISEINALSRANDLESSKSALEYLYLEASKNSIVSIDSSINNLIEAQLKTQMMAQVSDEYLLEIIDEPFIPELKNGPNRKSISIIGFLIGIIVSSLGSIIFYLRLDES